MLIRFLSESANLASYGRSFAMGRLPRAEGKADYLPATKSDSLIGRASGVEQHRLVPFKAVLSISLQNL